MVAEKGRIIRVVISAVDIIHNSSIEVLGIIRVVTSDIIKRERALADGGRGQRVIVSIVDRVGATTEL